METISTPIPNSIAKISEAMSKAQSQIQVAVFDKKANYGPYASFKSVREATIKALTDNGLTIFQPVNFDGTNYYLDTILAHSSGEFIKSSIQLMIDRKNMQGLGSAITYAKRYAWASIVGVVSDDDDDGVEASKEPTKPDNRYNPETYFDEHTGKEVKYPPSPTNVENKLKLLRDLTDLANIKKLTNDQVKNFIRLHSNDKKWKPSSQLTEKELSDVIDHIKTI